MIRTQRQILRGEQTEATVSSILSKAKYCGLLEKKGKEHKETKAALDRWLRYQANLAEIKVKRLRTMLPKANGLRKQKIEQKIREEEMRFLIIQVERDLK